MREIHDHEELLALCGGDLRCAWAAQGLRPHSTGRSRAWTGADGRAVAVAAPQLSVHDRLVVHGPADAAAPLVRAVLAEVGPTHRLLGDRALVHALVDMLPELALAADLGWMEDTGPLPADTPAGKAEWLPGSAEPEVARLVEAGFPASYAKPGVPGVHTWAGVREPDGRLAAVATLAWSAPDAALISGVATRPDARGRGHARDVCTFVLSEALSRHGRAALLVDDSNHAALRLYRSLGMRYRPLAAAYLPPPDSAPPR
ncbi:GNAT family N-acetyltransferase [Streptomyces thermolineatus]|uniref:GNAT family N-acetyltransferase n=1 Tax=Streptomyces thermolineatus TaxID=44033 RepID=UPI00384BD2FC